MRAGQHLTCCLSFLMLFGCPGDEKSSSGDEGDEGGSADDTGLPDDAAAVWEDVGLESSETLLGVYASSSGQYAAASGGQVWLHTNEWTQMDVDVDRADLNTIWGSGSGDDARLYVAGDEGWIGSWAPGVGFTTEDLGTPNHESIDGPGETNLMAVGWGGIYSNAEGSWEYVDIGSSLRLNHVWFDGTNGLAVGEEGAIAHYAAGAWTVEEAPVRRALFGADATSATDMWVVGERGTVLHSDGSTWEEIDLGTETSFWAVAAASSDEVYIVGNNGSAWLFDGTNWSELPTGLDNNLYSLSVAPSGAVFAGGNRGAMVKYKP